MRALLSWGRERNGWKRLLAPTFFCQDVLGALARELPIVLYEDAPHRALPARVDAHRSDVLLVTNIYGMRTQPRIQTDAVLLEDHSHDPLSTWAWASHADYAVASLRKTLPLPDGGVLWSPQGRELPLEREVTDAHLRAAYDRLGAMALKRLYLAGFDVNKRDFRARFAASERFVGVGEVSGISPFSRARLMSLPAQRWREARLSNLEAFSRAFGEEPRAHLLAAPFGAILLIDSYSLRERVRKTLIAERIYPAVLWSLETPVTKGIPPDQVALSRRLLHVHCDFRYSREDTAHVASRARAAIRRADVLACHQATQH
jgi:hypothetical protein